MRNKGDYITNMAKILSANNSFDEAVSDYNTKDEVLSRISNLAHGCSLVTEFILDNDEHFVNAKKTNNIVEVILSELTEIKEELRSMRKQIKELR